MDGFLSVTLCSVCLRTCGGMHHLKNFDQLQLGFLMKTPESGFHHDDAAQTESQDPSERKCKGLNIAGPCVINKGSPIPK